MRRFRKAKIVATLGPATSDEAAIARLFEAGADVFRLNFSHGAHEDHAERVTTIRRLEETFRRPIGIVADLQGPKLRVGEFAEGSVRLKTGGAFRLDLDAALGDAGRAPLPHPEIFAALEPGMGLLMDDGRIRLEVTEAGADFADTRIVTGGDLSNHKGVNVPDAVLDLSPLTEKDRTDLRFALQVGVDWIALSFVQRPEDIAEARKLIAGRAAVMAKLEKPMALNSLEEIVSLCDAIMVARGDLGVEMPPEEVPIQQKRIVAACRAAGKPVIVATQMLDSMVHAPSPTRAEASDVATAVYDGADAVMLSAETAVGDFAPEAVTMMERIIARVEKDDHYAKQLEASRLPPEATAADAITTAARQVAQTISAAAIVTFTSTGSTTLRAARERPTVPILGLTPRKDTARRLALAWGVHSVETEDLHTFRDMVVRAIAVAKREEMAEIGEAMAITAGVPFGTPGATNILRIAWIE
ncbi:MAG: pyruvate kinase [Magnetovibrio sp.]|nr:pyruvate kinase [Magnetovibrio sp.]